MSEVITIECPFCKKKVVKIMHRNDVYSAQTVRAGSNAKTIPKLTKGKNEILVEKCPNCGKTKKEIEKALKEGIPLSHEEIIRRAKEAGLPLKIKG